MTRAADHVSDKGVFYLHMRRRRLERAARSSVCTCAGLTCKQIAKFLAMHIHGSYLWSGPYLHMTCAAGFCAICTCPDPPPRTLAYKRNPYQHQHHSLQRTGNEDALPNAVAFSATAGATTDLCKRKPAASWQAGLQRSLRT